MHLNGGEAEFGCAGLSCTVEKHANIVCHYNPAKIDGYEDQLGSRRDSKPGKNVPRLSQQQNQRKGNKELRLHCQKTKCDSREPVMALVKGEIGSGEAQQHQSRDLSANEKMKQGRIGDGADCD